MAKMQIEIWSDIACPYCYIGMKKLESALADFPYKENIELVWRSFELSPELPKKAIEKSYYQYLSDTYGVTLDRARAMTHKTVQEAAKVGLVLDYEKLVVANTFDALRMVKLAARIDKATEMEDVLYEAYFTEGKDVSNQAVLLFLGEKVGLSKEEISRMLHSEELVEEVESDISIAEKLNINYVPFYRLNGKHFVEGSIQVEEYIRVLSNAYAEWSGKQSGEDASGETIQGQSCTIDGICT